MGSGRYDEAFYDEIDAWSRQSAQAIVPWLVDALAPASVIDVGCGRGAWLAAFKRSGVHDVLGLDGDHVDPGSLHIDPDEFRAVDLVAPPDLGRSFDLAVCLEVAEHLPPDSAGAFVRFLVDTAPVVLFSAAIPGQGGVQHVNEQWPSYWAEQFVANGHRPLDVVRPRFWNDERVAYYFAQNTMLYVRDEQCADVQARLGPSSWPTDGAPISVVHPLMFEAIRTDRRKRNASPPSLSSVLRALPGATRRAVRARAAQARRR